MLGALIALAAVAGLPAIAREFHIILLTEAMIYGMLAMSLDLVMGYTGLVSLGHAAFFGTGAYLAALGLLHTDTPFLVVLAGAAAATALLGLVIGYLSIRARGIYFAMLTLAMSEVVFRLVYDWRDVTGGSDGLAGVSARPLWVPGFGNLPLEQFEHYFYFVTAVVVIVFIGCRGLVCSRFGRVLEAIRENEQRCQFIGFDVKMYKLVTFVGSAGLAGLGGALYAPFAGFASPELLGFGLSGKVVVMTLMGGMGTLVGPFIGGLFITVLESLVSEYVEHYIIAIGLIFVVMVIALPGGLYGLVQRRRPFWWVCGGAGVAERLGTRVVATAGREESR